MKFSNLEEYKNFDFELKDRTTPGVSAMIRVKNEEETLQASVTAIAPFVDEIILVDNASNDRTPDIIKSISEEFSGKVRSYYYPFSITKCGIDFKSTESNSVRSLAYYYNWCKSKCSYSSLLKWDADMIIGVEQHDFWKNLRSKAMEEPHIFVRPKARLIIRWEQNFYVAKGEPFGEPRLYPNLADLHYIKFNGQNTERLGYAGQLLEEELPESFTDFRSDLSEVNYYEVKLIGKDEFDHWDDEALSNLLKFWGGNHQTRLQYKIFSDPGAYVKDGTLTPFQDPILALIST